MRPKNFPARKLARKIRAMKRQGLKTDDLDLAAARAIRTKKDRSARAKLHRN